MSRMKRSQPDSRLNDSDLEPPPSKLPNLNNSQDPTLQKTQDMNGKDADPLLPYMAEFSDIQSEILKLDEDCAQEQMNIQKKFDEMKKPWFKHRQEIIDKIPSFWSRTIQHHPLFCNLIVEDIQILDCLKRIDLDDNLDEHGSYKITFNFEEKAKEYMEPLILTKHVNFEPSKEPVLHCTDIKWKEGKNPIEAASKLRDESDDQSDIRSIFEWFSYSEWADHADLGEVIRREIWHTPLAYYMEDTTPDQEVYQSSQDEEFDDDDQDDDDDSEDDEDLEDDEEVQDLA